MKNVRIATILAIVIPLACALVLGLMSMSQYKRREVALAAEKAQRDNVNALNEALKRVEVAPLMDKQIAADDTADEQAAFLTQLRINAQGAGVKLDQYLNMGQIVQATPDPNRAQTQSIFRPVASTLTVSGPYAGVRAFAYSLLRADRLMNMNGVTWKRDSNGKTTTLSFTLIRYVKDPATFVETTTVPAGGAASSGGAIQ